MNRYGLMAQKHWARWLPGRYSQIEDPDSFFSDLGTQAAQQIDQLSLQLAGDDQPGRGLPGQGGPAGPGAAPGRGDRPGRHDPAGARAGDDRRRRPTDPADEQSDIPRHQRPSRLPPSQPRRPGTLRRRDPGPR